MEERSERQRALLELLRKESFSRQDAICRAMERRGYRVTQPSISRDIKDLGVVKVGGRYLPPASVVVSTANSPLGKKQNSLVKEMDTAGPHLLVIKTQTGAANVVAVQVEDLKLEGLVGTVAGDDTLFVAVKDKRSQGKIETKLREVLGL